MYYLSGSGYLAADRQKIPFVKGDILLVPPRTVHGSVSENGFVNISVGGNFGHLLMFDRPVKLHDDARAQGATLAGLIYDNRCAGKAYVSALCTAYIRFLLQNAEYENRVSRAVADMLTAIAERFADPAFHVDALLKHSGYAPDYLRAEFKRRTGMTPVRFLTKTRIDHARRLIEIYGQSITVAEAAHACGFEDPVYFSKRFKQLVGCSPDSCR